MVGRSRSISHLILSPPSSDLGLSACDVAAISTDADVGFSAISVSRHDSASNGSAAFSLIATATILVTAPLAML